MALTRPHVPGDDASRVERAVALAEDLLCESEASTTRAERRRQHRLGRIVADPAGRELVQRLTDEVLRLDRPRPAARRFAAIVRRGGVPPSLGPVDRLLLRAGAKVAPIAPPLVMPLVRRRIVAETAGLVIPAEDGPLTAHLAARRAAGIALNVNVLGETILSDSEAQTRMDRVVAMIERPDVDYVSVKISALCAQLDVLAFDHSLDRICNALRRVMSAAAACDPPVFVNLDMEEYADLDLTIAAFERVLMEPALLTFEAGIVVQAYLPDAHAALERIGRWALARRAAGGAAVKVRIVKGANLAMEQVDAELHGWVQAPYASKADTDASYKRLLDAALAPELHGALRVGVASHNLFDLAWALVLRDELPPGARGRMDLEMLEGMVPGQARAVERRVGALRLYCPVVRRDEFDASLAYLARRFDENTGPENFLRAAFSMRPRSSAFAQQAARFREAVAARHTVSIAPRRPGELPAGGDGFHNQADSDFAAPAVRAAITAALAHPPPADGFAMITSVTAVDELVADAVAGQAPWERLGDGRAALLRRAADVMQAGRAETIALMADESGKTAREGDPEVSEAVDAARFHAAAVLPAGTHPVGLVVVASPWNFPYAIPAGGVFAALAAGCTVILKPAPEARRTAWRLAEQCWAAGIPRDVLQFAACPDDDTGRRLITHPDVATVVLTGSYATAQTFLQWKPGLRLFAETSGKNAIVVTESADMDAAIRDIVRSAFGHAGQKCSAASLAIVTAQVHDSPGFLPRLVAAARTLRVGSALDPATVMGPLIAPPTAALDRALRVLDGGERWLLQPRQLDESGRLWSPGIRAGVRPGSWFHQTECFGPVLGVMRARDLDHAIELQNGTPFGLTAGLHALDEDEIAHWTARVEAGNAYVNRHTTGAVVGRQPFGGWKHSSVGGGPKAGGPLYAAAFRTPAPDAVDLDAAGAGYRHACTHHYASRDLAGLRAERNLWRCCPIGRVVVRTGDDTPPGAAEAALLAASVCAVEAELADRAGADDGALAAQLAADPPARLRCLTAIGDDLAALCHRLGITVDRTPVSADGVAELWHWLREQVVSETRHRYGRIRS